MSRPPPVPRPRPVPTEPLLPLIFRRISFACYRRSERYRWYAAHAAPDEMLPVPDLADALMLELLARLPARTVRALRPRGVRALARTLALGIQSLECAGHGVFLAARAAFHALRRVRRLLRRTPLGTPDDPRAAGTSRERSHV